MTTIGKSKLADIEGQIIASAKVNKLVTTQRK